MSLALSPLPFPPLLSDYGDYHEVKPHQLCDVDAEAQTQHPHAYSASTLRQRTSPLPVPWLL